VKAKGKARAEGSELLTNADLKVKPGVCYALIGRNGTGKSSEFDLIVYSIVFKVLVGNYQRLIYFTALLKAIAQKLIPGIPIQTRISILQQTVSEEDSSPEEGKNESKLSVLEEVIDRATSKNEIQHEIDGMSYALQLTIELTKHSSFQRNR